MICSVCKQPVEPRDAYTRVMAWEKPAGTHQGGSSLVLRERLEVFACATCIARMSVIPGQESLL